jgi:hypothetical protein
VRELLLSIDTNRHTLAVRRTLERRRRDVLHTAHERCYRGASSHPLSLHCQRLEDAPNGHFRNGTERVAREIDITLALPLQYPCITLRESLRARRKSAIWLLQMW